MYICMSRGSGRDMYICIYVYMYICIYVYAYIHIYIYTYTSRTPRDIHIYIYTYILTFERRTIYTFISIQSIVRIEMQSYRQSSSRMKRVYSATFEGQYICIYVYMYI